MSIAFYEREVCVNFLYAAACEWKFFLHLDNQLLYHLLKRRFYSLNCLCSFVKMLVYSGFSFIDLLVYLYINTIQSLLLEVHNKTKQMRVSFMTLFSVKIVLAILGSLHFRSIESAL